jgi:excisionase family DNA binding protein
LPWQVGLSASLASVYTRPLRDAAAVSAPNPSPATATSEDNEPGLLSEPLLRAEQVAELLAVKTNTVYELSRRRRDPLPYVRIGRSKRFSRPVIARWLQAQVNM